METMELLESLYAAEVLKLATKLHEASKPPRMPKVMHDESTTLNTFLLQAHDQLQLARRLIAARNSGAPAATRIP